MSTIDSLNEQYVGKLNSISILRSYLGKVESEQNRVGLTEKEKASNSLGLLKCLKAEINCKNYALLVDSLLVGEHLEECWIAITNYTNALHNGSIQGEIVNLETAQKVFNNTKDSFAAKYNYTVASPETLNKILPQAVRDAISIEEKSVEGIKDEARELLNKEYTIDLKLSDPIHTNEDLPTEMLVARIPRQEVSQQLLKDLGVRSNYKNVITDLRKNGNVVINTSFEHVDDKEIDGFVVAYILRFIETFPLGSVHVHIFDQNTNYLYKRLNNCFQSEDFGELSKGIIQLHSSISELANFRDVICDDIFKKTSVDKPDLYSIYESDRSDAFNLIIIRDGLVDGSGYAQAETLDAINSLTQSNDTGHTCGLRFLVVDNSSSFEKSLMPANKHLIEQIQKNCELRLDYQNNRFAINGNDAEVLRINEELDMFIQKRTKAITDLLTGLEKSYISLEEVSAESVDENIGNIMYIPVGKSAGKTVELPFSCKDEDGTVAGQCVGYMAIGQSGSGKSSFFHSVVLNGCMKYSPKDLQFWLLDFKNGGASSKYSKSGIPHIRIIAENNKIDDALCLFQMVLEEMERRSKAFNKQFTNDIVEYNRKAKEEGLEYFPRIIIAIDEIQEIFRDDNAAVIKDQISSIASRMRSMGMHFVMVAQNLCEGKAYMLKEAFLPSATGRICFRVAQDIPRDSGFEDEFFDRRQEITELKTGEAYVSYGKDTIKKVKMAFASPEEMSDKYFADIRKNYPEYANLRPLVIGAKKRLSINASRQGITGNYFDVVNDIEKEKSGYNAVIGEDVYRMSPLRIQFSQDENSSVLFLGSDKRIASSLCASTALSLARQKVKVHMFNGDRTKIQEDGESVQHPFMYVCQSIESRNGLVENHRLDELKPVLKKLYTEYLKRQAMVQKADAVDPTFEPIFLLINDLFGIESFVSNDIIENEPEEVGEEPAKKRGFNFNYNIFGSKDSKDDVEIGDFRESIQTIMTALLKNGYRYNMHLILAIKGDPSAWRGMRMASEINNVVMFNDTEYADQVDNSYYLKEMLKNISNDGEDETMAVWTRRKQFSKIRPIIYRLSRSDEEEALKKLIRGGR